MLFLPIFTDNSRIFLLYKCGKWLSYQLESWPVTRYLYKKRRKERKEKRRNKRDDISIAITMDDKQT